MVRVIVIDDEIIIRNSVSNYIENNIDGVCVEGRFCDGDEAIEYLKNHDVEIVLSDINMPNVSGVEVAKYIYENKPYIKVIMLSGYREFEYAQSAIKYGVTAYLLKPTDTDELEEVICETAKQLEQSESILDRFVSLTKSIFEAIVQGNRDGAIDLIKGVIEENTELDNASLCRYISDLFQIVFEKIHLHMNRNLIGEGLDYAVLQKGFFTNRNDISDAASGIIDSILAKLSPNSNDEDLILRQAIRFIDENFAGDISLQSVADSVYLHPVYLSRIFKKKTGQNFSDYLLNKRMKYAGELLMKNRSITEVSEKCGYNNSGYFSRVFKEYYRCTPKEYSRKRMG